MSMQAAPSLARRLSWSEADLVEGTEASLWPAAGPDDAQAGPPPPPAPFRAVLSWVSPHVLRFETSTPEPLPDLVLAHTLAVRGPACFVAQKSYQVGTTAAFEPPLTVHIFERRDVFRLPVALPVLLVANGQSWELTSMDCSAGGLRLCVPAHLEVGSEVQVRMALPKGAVTLAAVVRHHELLATGQPRPVGRSAGETEQLPYVTGLQFLDVPNEAARHLGEWLGRHQRRLMPRVSRRLPIEYLPTGRCYPLESFAREISPGDIIFETRRPLRPGERLSVRARIRRRDFELAGTVVACRQSVDDDVVTHCVRVSFAEQADDLEAKFRKVVRELAIEGISAPT